MAPSLSIQQTIPEIDGNVFRQAWTKVMSSRPRPHLLRKLVHVEFEEFREKVLKQDPTFVHETVDSLYSGDCYIIKNAFNPADLKSLKLKLHEHGKKSPSTSAKILDGVADYHEEMREESERPSSNGYMTVDHSYYFFPWNQDPLGLFPVLRDRWRIFKVLSGLKATEYESNLPSDGVVDRIQVIHYPPGGGKITIHADPYKNQKVIAGAMLTEPGQDYDQGGFFLLGPDKKPVWFEDQIPLGSIVSAFPSMFHGVLPIDPLKSPDWSTIRGRWYLAMYSPDSHHLKNREIAVPPPPEFQI